MFKTDWLNYKYSHVEKDHVSLPINHSRTYNGTVHVSIKNGNKDTCAIKKNEM